MYPKKEIKKKSTKGKYCNFIGIIKEVKFLSEIPSKIRCPECNRSMKPYITDCGCGWDCACYLKLSFKKHRRNK